MPISRTWLHGVRLELTILLGGLFLIGSFFALTVPIGYGSDEPVHAYKAYAVSNGQLSLHEIGPWTSASGSPITVYGGSVPQSLVDLEVSSNDKKLKAACTAQSCDKPMFYNKNEIQNSGNVNINSEMITTDFWGANSYSFIGYVPSAIGFGIARILNMSTENAVYLARIVNLIVCILLIGFSFRLLSATRARWIIFSVALFPLILISFSSLGIDGLLIALSITLMALISWLHMNPRNPPRSIIVTSIIVAAVIPLVKLPYVLLSLLLLFLPIFHKQRKGIFQRIILASIIVIPALLWNVIAADATNTQSLTVHAGITEPDSSKQIKHILHHPTQFAAALSTSLLKESPISNINKVTQQPGLAAPMDLVLTSFSLIFISALYASSSFARRKKSQALAIGIFSAAALSFAGIVLSMYLTYNAVGASSIAGIQGRYLLPLYGFIALAVALQIKATFPNQSQARKHLFVCIVLAVNVLVAVWYVNIVY